MFGRKRPILCFQSQAKSCLHRTNNLTTHQPTPIQYSREIIQTKSKHEQNNDYWFKQITYITYFNLLTHLLTDSLTHLLTYFLTYLLNGTHEKRDPGSNGPRVPQRHHQRPGNFCRESCKWYPAKSSKTCPWNAIGWKWHFRLIWRQHTYGLWLCPKTHTDIYIYATTYTRRLHFR
jgi:hypothetical protein